jgi:DNA helicase HerA-like ATPase
MLDSTRLKAELTHIHRALNVVIGGPRGRSVIEDLRETSRGTNTAVVWQALFADCLRVVHAAVAADEVIGDDEVDAIYEMVFSVARSFAAAQPDEYGEFNAIDQATVRPFLERYAADRGPFGGSATMRWPGLSLCRRSAETGETEPLERYERMMTWLIGAACQVGGVTEADPRWRGRMGDLQELRRELAGTVAAIESPAVDRRVQAFLSPRRVFASVQQASSVFEVDPFDVESVHAEARATFERIVDHAATPAHQGDRGGRMLLVLGDSGAGKTHLLRAFRRHVHERGRGFVAYAQLQSTSEDYPRYLLQHVVDSLARPYEGPASGRTGLHELASGLPRLVGGSLAKRIEELSHDDGDNPAANLADNVNALVDDLLVESDLASFDPDLLRVLLYALRPDQRTIARVYKYLRCEDMTAHDRKWIGDVAPRTGADHPSRMIAELGRLAFVTQQAALVLMVDQAELAGFEASSAVAFRRAIDALYKVVSEVPSVVAVVACLGDLWTSVRDRLTRSALDRLEKDPPIERLSINRTYPEIEAIVARRLAWLYAELGAVHRPEAPVYPIPEAQLRTLVNRRTRDVLEWCHQFQARSAAEGRVVEEQPAEPIIDRPPTASTEGDLDQIAAAWNDARHATGIEVPDDDDRIMELVGQAARACVDETGVSVVTQRPEQGVVLAALANGADKLEVAIGLTNRGHQRGAFAAQVERLRGVSKAATPVVIRTIDFPTGKSSSKVIADLLKAGGRREQLDSATLRVLVAHEQFRPTFPADRVAAWRRRDRPIASLPAISRILDLDRMLAAGPTPPPSAPPPVVPTAAAGAPVGPPNAVRANAPRPQPYVAAASPPAVGSTQPHPQPLASSAADSTARPNAGPLRVGTASGLRTEPRTIEMQSMLRHTGVLGTTGSGKTTLALNLLEQLLERDIAVVLVDRKGDLAGYARTDWWREAADPDRARRLAERLDVRLFTPGTRGGRPLSLPVVPELEQLPEHERQREVQYAAQALAAMMRFGDGSADTARRAILVQAITVLAERQAPAGLEELIGLLEDRDDELIARAGRYDDRHFKRLVQDLETVRLNDGDLFDAASEPLSAQTLIGRGPDGRTPLAITSTRFLGEAERIQSWVAHLIGCLNRHVVKTPSSELRMVLMLDEADVFLPAGTAKPPSKEPLQDLLKRSRTSGLGIVLASQSPGDFDYRSRELINTWFLGKIGDRRSIEKMKPLFEHRPAVGGKLGNLEPGRFVMLQDGNTADLERTPSLLRTTQLGEDELMTLARTRR